MHTPVLTRHLSLVTCHCCIRCEAALEFVRERDGFKGVAADGDEDEVRFGD